MMMDQLIRLSKEARNDEAVKHALAVRAAVSLGNYTAFFKLYRTAPNLSPYLMGMYDYELVPRPLGVTELNATDF